MPEIMLSAGARVAVVAPAGRFSRERVLAGAELLRSWQLQPVFAPNLLNGGDRYHSAGIADRLADLAWATTSPDIDAIWLARGGFGCAHLLPYLPWQELQPRPLIGFSDATALHAALWQAGWTTSAGGALVHGPVLQTLAPAPPLGSLSPVLVDAESRQALSELLLHGKPVDLPGRQLCGPEADVAGPVVGGNLTVLASLCGTPWQLQAAGCIVILEDVGEAPYRLDRCLTQLLHSGSLQGAVAIGFGQLLDSNASDGDGRDYTALDVLAERTAGLGIAVLADLPVGHGARNIAWPFGRRGIASDSGIRWAYDF